MAAAASPQQQPAQPPLPLLRLDGTDSNATNRHRAKAGGAGTKGRHRSGGAELDASLPLPSYAVRSSAASRQTQPWAAAVLSSPSPLPSREEFESARQNLKLSLGETEVREQAGGDPAEGGVQPPVALAAKQQRQPLQLRTSPEYEAFRERELRRAAAAAAAAATAAATPSSTTAGGTST